jgi:hypothetical protein
MLLFTPKRTLTYIGEYSIEYRWKYDVRDIDQLNTNVLKLIRETHFSKRKDKEHLNNVHKVLDEHWFELSEVLYLFLCLRSEKKRKVKQSTEQHVIDVTNYVFGAIWEEINQHITNLNKRRDATNEL